MKRALRFVKEFSERNPTVICILVVLATMSVDFSTGREIRFPLLYLLPIGLAAWIGRRTLAYALSVLLPFVRVVFEILWQIPELLGIESINAAVEVLALTLYVYLVGEKATQVRQMEKTITTKEAEMQRLRAFTQVMGMTLQGRGISPGLEDGVVMVYVPEHKSLLGAQSIARNDVEQEVNRFDRALAESISELDNIQEHCDPQQASDEIALIEARLAMLRDPSFAEECRRRVREDLVKAEHAVASEVRRVEELIQGLKQEFMRERSADIRDIGCQVMRNLRISGEWIPHRLTSLPPGTVLVAEELLLSDVLQIDPVNVVALVTERTGPASHVAILARIRHIPAICDIKDVTSLLVSGDRLLVDAEAGTVTVAPTEAQAKRFAKRKDQSTRFMTSASHEPVQHAITKDGVRIRLHANIGRADEAPLVLEYRMDGVGLFILR
jgi:signal transduction protein with GAF and PtsI domain